MGNTSFEDWFGNHVLLYEDVLDHALAKHPEFAHWIDQIGHILANPDELRASSSDPRVVLYYQHRLDIYSGKWLVVVVKRLERHYISTFYITNRIKSGVILWKK